jgi:hypothetical protein
VSWQTIRPTHTHTWLFDPEAQMPKREATVVIFNVVIFCAVYRLSMVCYFVWHVYFCVLCLIVVPQPPCEKPIFSSIK